MASSLSHDEAMAERNIKHLMKDGVPKPEAAMELRDSKRQKMDDLSGEPTLGQPLIPENQKFWTAVAESPEINYRSILQLHATQMKHIKEDRSDDDFQSRILRYSHYDAVIYLGIVNTYRDWIKDNFMSMDMQQGCKKQFCDGLYEAIQYDSILDDGEVVTTYIECEKHRKKRQQA